MSDTLFNAYTKRLDTALKEALQINEELKEYTNKHNFAPDWDIFNTESKIVAENHELTRQNEILRENYKVLMLLMRDLIKPT